MNLKKKLWSILQTHNLVYKLFICDIFVEVMADKLFIIRIKPKPGRQSCSNVS